MRSRPASSSAPLRRCPSGILRACAITSVARASQSRLWANRANTGLEEEPTIICARTGESARRARSTTVAADLDGVVTSLVSIFWIRCSILLSPANQSRLPTILRNHTRDDPLPPECSDQILRKLLHKLRLGSVDYGHKSGEVGRRNPTTLVTRTQKRCCSVNPSRSI